MTAQAAQIQEIETPKPKRLPVSQDPERLWKPGQSGNPAGRPKGSRHKLAEMVIRDLSAEWEKRGAEAMGDLSSKQLVRVCVSILPKEATLTLRTELDGMTDVELRAFINRELEANGAVPAIEHKTIEQSSRDLPKLEDDSSKPALSD